MRLRHDFSRGCVLQLGWLPKYYERLHLTTNGSKPMESLLPKSGGRRIYTFQEKSVKLFACIFVPILKAASSKIPSHEGNLTVRQAVFLFLIVLKIAFSHHQLENNLRDGSSNIQAITRWHGLYCISSRRSSPTPSYRRILRDVRAAYHQTSPSERPK